MNEAAFSPGFRLSLLDVIFLMAGLIVAVVAGIFVWWAGFIVSFVVLHFFLFCNVFRIARVSELIWAGIFAVLAGATAISGVPGWGITAVGSLMVSAFLIFRETRKTDYHGVFWKKWNPDLPQWWNSQQVEGDSATVPES